MILDALSRSVLEFEAAWWDAHPSGKHTGHKEEAVRAALKMPPARYYQLLGRLIDDAGANAAHPQLCSRLRRIRDDKAADRSRRMNLTPPHPTERNHP